MATYEETKNALNMLGFSEREQCDMFKILSSVLHLGNIRFLESIIETENEQDQEGAMIQVSVPCTHGYNKYIEIYNKKKRFR